MLTVFNRKELTTTFDMGVFHTVCGKLSDAGIPYRTIAGSLTNPGRHHGVPGIDPSASVQYLIFVHKNDYDRARSALR